MPRVRRGYNHATGGNGTTKYRKYGQKSRKKREKVPSIDPPVQIVMKYKGYCKECKTEMKKGVSAMYDGAYVWHLPEECDGR